jgi:excisionase family DNA binding protein
MGSLAKEFLTTRELAELLHITERKVYDLAASGQVPCSRATGKLLFPRRAIEQWVAHHSSGAVTANPNRQAKVFLGSQDPLLSWSLGTSGVELASLFEGSLDGLDRFERGEGLAAATHLYEPETGDWNVATIRDRFEYAPVALVEFAWRQRGFIVPVGKEDSVSDIKAIKGRRIVPRQHGAGGQVLLQILMEQAGVTATDVEWVEPARAETELAIAVLEGKAEVAFGLQATANQLQLGFVPQIRERFDILVDRAAWFDPPLQRLFSFFRSEAFMAKAAGMGGYDVSGLGTVHFNGA